MAQDEARVLTSLWTLVMSSREAMAVAFSNLFCVGHIQTVDTKSRLDDSVEKTAIRPYNLCYQNLHADRRTDTPRKCRTSPTGHTVPDIIATDILELPFASLFAICSPSQTNSREEPLLAVSTSLQGGQPFNVTKTKLLVADPGGHAM